MGEGGERASLFENLRTRTEQLIDPRFRAAKGTLLAVSPAVADYQIPQNKSLPPVLQLQAGRDEYISVRRLDGDQFDQIMDVIPPSGGTPGSIRFVIPANHLDDENIALLAVPVTVGCSDEAKEQELEKAIGADEKYGFHFEQLLSQRPDLYREEDWTVFGLGIYLATRKGNAVYTARAVPLHIGGAVKENIYNFQQQKPDDRGRVTLASLSGAILPYRSQPVIDAMADMAREAGKFYVLQAGSTQSDKERKEKESKVTREVVQPV